MAKDEIEISFDLSKITKLTKNKTIISLLILLFIFYLSLSVRLITVDQPYLLASDPHFWYRMTKFIVENNIPEYDPLRLWPTPPKFNPGLFPYLAAYSYHITKFFVNIDLYRFLFWFSAIVAALLVFPAFWIGRELHSNKAGLFAAFFIGLSPSILSRTMAGFFDTDCTNILFSLLTVALFLSAYNRVDETNFRKPVPIILSILCGLSLAVFALTWTGFAYIPWLFIGLLFFHFAYKIIIAEGDNFSKKLKNGFIFFKSHLIVYIILFLTFLVFTYPAEGFGPINSIIKLTTFFQTAKAEGGIFPNVWVSISEEMSASFREVIARVGTYNFYLGIFGLIALFFLFLKNFRKKSIYPETFIFMVLWTLPTLYGSIWAVRFAMLLSIPISICAGIALGILFNFFIDFFKKIREDFLRKVAIILLLILIFSTFHITYSLYNISYASVKGYGSGISQNWVNAMNWLKNNTPECTVVATYWDPGYWIAALSERKVIFDGGSQNSKKYTELEDLNGLDCVEDRHGYIEEIDGIKYCVTSRIQDMAGVLYTSNETWAAKVLETYMGNCSELYELASHDLIGKSHWWTYFSNWNPEKGKGQAYDYFMVQLQNQKDLLFENGTALIYGPFILKIVNKNGSQELTPLLLQQGKYYKIRNLVLTVNNTPTKLTYPDASVPGTLWIDPSLRVAIFMPEQIENSLFTRMFFYNGAGLKYFEPVHLNPEVKLFRFKVEEFRKDLEEGKI
jgi:dolichyl-diphosphooligosaccharide--protein glycosyltransferase